jgi:hypothetical protein
MDSVDDRLEQQQAFRREPETTADHHAVIDRTCQLLLQHRPDSLVGCDHAKVCLPSLFPNFGCADRNSAVDLLCIEARRYGGIGEVYRFRLLADE